MQSLAGFGQVGDIKTQRDNQRAVGCDGVEFYAIASAGGDLPAFICIILCQLLSDA